MKSLETSASPFPVLPSRTFEIDPLQDSRWTTFTERSPVASLYHRREWLQALKNTYDFEPVAVSSSPPGSDLENAIVFCRVRSRLTGKRLVSVPFSDHCEPLASDLAEADELVADLARAVAQEGWRYLEIRPVNYLPSSQNGLGICNAYYLHRLDLQRSEDVLFKSFHKNCIQRKILRAERESLRYDEGSSEALLQQFYKLLVMARRRLGLPPQPLKWFRNLIASLGQDLKIRVAYKGDVPVASILTIRAKGTMVYKYGCSDTHFNNLGGTVLLLWNAIREAQAAGMDELDMGRSDIGQDGLIAFKEHWGAERSLLNYWCYPAPKGPPGQGSIMALLRKVASRAPESSLTMLGHLLYKHTA